MCYARARLNILEIMFLTKEAQDNFKSCFRHLSPSTGDADFYGLWENNAGLSVSRGSCVKSGRCLKTVSAGSDLPTVSS